MNKFTIGIDVGGTNIKMGLVSSQGKIISRARLDTPPFRQRKEKLIDALVGKIQTFLDDNRLTRSAIEGVGIGLPGAIDPKAGVVHYLPNIPGWKDVPLKKILQKRWRLYVVLENDVNLITLGEWRFGAGKGLSDLVCMTLGTGVGGGLILNNALYRGPGFAAGELGHIPLNEKGPDCSCGGFGCFEQYVGNRTLQEKAAKIFKNKRLRLEDVFALADQGNVRAVQFWEEAATHIGNALVGVVNLLNPKLIIIGGGVSNNYKYLGARIKAVIAQRAMIIQRQTVRITRAKLGDDAGIMGAQVLVKEKF